MFNEAYESPSDPAEVPRFLTTLAGALSVTADSATIGFGILDVFQEPTQGKITLSSFSRNVAQGQAVAVTYTDPTAERRRTSPSRTQPVTRPPPSPPE